MIHWVHLRGGGGGSESVKRYVMQASYRIQNPALKRSGSLDRITFNFRRKLVQLRFIFTVTTQKGAFRVHLVSS